VIKEAVHARVEQQLPAIVKSLTDRIGDNIDQLIDAKLMVISYFEAHPELLNSLFQEIGRKELRFMQNFGFYYLRLPDGHRAVQGSCVSIRTGGCCRSAG